MASAIAAATMRPGGIACRVVERQRVGDLEIPAAHGQLVEVRRLARGADESAEDVDGDAALYGYVRFKDTNNRRSAWIPLEHILVAPSSLNNLLPTQIAAALPFGASPTTTGSGASSTGGSVRPRVTMKSNLYSTSTDEMRRARDSMGGGGASLLEFFDARLRRDVQCPSPIRYIHYLSRLSFAPWYFSPVDVLYPSFEWRYDDVLYDAFVCPFTLQFFTSARALERYHRILCLRREPLPPVGHGQRRPRPRVPATKEALDAVPEDANPLRPVASVGAPSPQPFGFRDSKDYVANRLHPPGGEEIYRDDEAGVSLFEVNGKRSPCYARNLFLIGKCFLENKLAGHDVDVYMFYTVCLHAAKHTAWILDNLLHPTSAIEEEEEGASSLASRQHSLDAMVFAGYFSWEDGVHHDNLACIAVLPCFSGIGLGHFLIAASYELAYRRGDVGSPERPLSDLGQLAYRVYWRDVIFQWLALRMADELETVFDFHPPSTGGLPVQVDEPSATKHIDSGAMHSHGSTPSLYTSTRLQLKRHALSASLEPPPPQSQQGVPHRSTKWPFSRRAQQTELLRRCIAFLRRACDTMRGSCAAPQAAADANHAEPGWGGTRVGSRGMLHAAVDVDDESGEVSSEQPDAGDNDSDTPSSSAMGAADIKTASHSGDAASDAAVLSQKLLAHIKSSGGGELRLDLRLRVSQVAQEVHLEEADVLDCFLWCGLMHRGSQEGTTCVKVPILYVAAMVERRLGGNSDADAPQGAARFAHFDPSKLTVPDRSTRKRR